MRGGISYIANWYGKANNKYMKNYEEGTPSKYIMHLDAKSVPVVCKLQVQNTTFYSV